MRRHRLVIAAPPSANESYMNRQHGRGRMRTPVYKRWRARMAAHIADEIEPFPPKTPIAVTIFAAVKRQRDMDNLLKPFGDAMKESGIIKDDRWIDVAAVYRVPVDAMPEDMAVVIIRELDPWEIVNALQAARQG